MSILDIQILDPASATSAETPDGWIDIGPAATSSAFDSASDIFTLAANIFSSNGADPAFPAAPVTGATIDLSKSENWPALIASVDVHDLTETLNSSTSFTVADPKSGISAQFIGTGFTIESFFGVTILETGTITGFNLSQNGATIATGIGYSISASTLDNVLVQCAEQGNAMPLFDLWFSIPTTVSGTAAVIASSLSLLEPYVHITAVDITSGVLVVDAAQFKSYETVLNKVAGGFDVEDKEANIKAALTATGSALLADVKDIKALILSNGATAPLQLTAAQAATDGALLKKLSGSAILEVEATNGDWTTTGHGNGLTIDDLKGVDAITGDGTGEHFVFAADWGKATITDFATHFTGTGHDFVQLAKSEFAQGDTTLLADAKLNAAGTAMVVTAGTDQLTFTGLTLKELKTAINGGDFTFV